MKIMVALGQGVVVGMIGLVGVGSCASGCSGSSTQAPNGAGGAGGPPPTLIGDPIPPAMTMMPPPGSGAGRVDSQLLPPLHDSATVYDPNDLGPIEIQIDVPDAPTLAAIEAQTAGGPTKTAAVFHAPELGQGAAGSIGLHGSTSRAALQKSYQIKLKSDQPPWRGSHTINLLKHPYDLTRVRERISFEYFRRVPNFVSLRLGFVHLNLNGVDHGLFEWVEEPDAQFLFAHGLDPTGSVFKAKTFSFLPIDDATAADKTKMATIVTASANGDVAKLRRMVAAVNDLSQDINDVVGHYFNRENYMTWLAVNVLMGNWDTGSQNFLLYSPSGYEGWYFLPWDYDGALGWNEQPGEPARPRYRRGLSNWWWISLHQRFLSDPKNFTDVDALVRELASTTLSGADTATMVAAHHDIVRKYVQVSPDLDNLPCDLAGTPGAMPEFEAEYARVAGYLPQSYAEYQATLTRPMPFWLYDPVMAPGRVTFSWGASYGLQGGTLTYDVEVNDAEDFGASTSVLTQTGLATPRFSTPLPAGHHFWRVKARAAAGDPQQDWQLAFKDHVPFDAP